MEEYKTITLQQFLTRIRKKGYVPTKTYSQCSEVIYIRVQSNLYRKQFLLHVSEKSSMHSNNPDHIITAEDNNYRNFRQREYLERINLDNVACCSNDNLCVKDCTLYNCYLFSTTNDSFDDKLEGLDSDSDSDLNSDVSDSDSEIEIDDYPVQDIYPVFTVSQFVSNIDTFEELLLKHYSLVTEAEEAMNEAEIERLLNIFDKQKDKIRAKVYNIHREAYNIRRDISKYSNNLQRVYVLKTKSVDERDRVRFKIERLAEETEGKIDNLNNKLCDIRNHSDSLLKKYRNYIKHFDLLD